MIRKILNKLRSFLFSRVVVVSLLLIMQVAFFVVLLSRLSQYFIVVSAALEILSIIVSLVVFNSNLNPSYKLAFIVPIMLFPLFGGLFYITVGRPRVSSRFGRRLHGVEEKIHSTLLLEAPSIQLSKLPSNLLSQSIYLTQAGFPPFENTDTTYYKSGEEKFEAIIRALESAKRYIMLEYFIIAEGEMWNRVLEILERKVKEGVEVRVIYDGLGCLFTLHTNYSKYLNEKGIHCVEFNPYVPILTSLMNNRDHRKILVTDGHTGFMGGVNLADEYINVIEKHGHWRDSAIKLHGEAVWSMVTMFISMWSGVTGEELEISRYRPLPEEISVESTGIVQPYSDSPLDSALVGEMVYLNMINRANRYIYICTPYLIIDNETSTALLLAAQSGVDVRIMTPHIADKWYVHLISRAHYPHLVKGGVKIYEYTPGFVHSKTFVSDDAVATVGTVNLDYRSLYLHFECGVWMANTASVVDIREDFLNTLEQCEQITLDSPIMNARFPKRLARAILKIFAPLM